MKKATMWTGFTIYYNNEICIAEIDFEIMNMGLIKNKWCATDPTDVKIPQRLRPKVPVTARNDGTGQIWLKISPNGYLDAYATQNWSEDKPIPIRATMVWRRQ